MPLFQLSPLISSLSHSGKSGDDCKGLGMRRCLLALLPVRPVQFVTSLHPLIAMPQTDSDTSNDPTFADFNTPTTVEVKRLITKLQQSHDLRYKLINLESWALASTMDQFLPGFWSRFLENRRTALKQFLQRKQRDNSQATTSESPFSCDRK